jgi:hypothetical protein
VTPRNDWLLVAGSLSLLAALLHLAVIVGGPGWYRFFGAGEALAQAAERGSWIPAVVTLGIAALLAIWSAYAFAAAGAIRQLPLMRTALVAISAIYLARGLFVLDPDAFARPDLSPEFMLWSSLIVLVYGVTYAVGTWQAWPHLSKRNAA